MATYRSNLSTTFIIVGCSCSSFVTDEGYGNCQGSLVSGRPICYVNEPSNCADLQDSTLPDARGKRFSSEACLRNQGKTYTSVFLYCIQYQV